MKNVALAKSVLIPLGLTAANAGIHKKILGLGTTPLIMSNDEIERIIKMKQKNANEDFLVCY